MCGKNSFRNVQNSFECVAKIQFPFIWLFKFFFTVIAECSGRSLFCVRGADLAVTKNPVEADRPGFEIHLSVARKWCFSSSKTKKVTCFGAPPARDRVRGRSPSGARPTIANFCGNFLIEKKIKRVGPFHLFRRSKFQGGPPPHYGYSTG